MSSWAACVVLHAAQRCAEQRIAPHAIRPPQVLRHQGKTLTLVRVLRKSGTVSSSAAFGRSVGGLLFADGCCEFDCFADADVWVLAEELYGDAEGVVAKQAFGVCDDVVGASGDVFDAFVESFVCRAWQVFDVCEECSHRGYGFVCTDFGVGVACDRYRFPGGTGFFCCAQVECEFRSCVQVQVSGAMDPGVVWFDCADDARVRNVFASPPVHPFVCCVFAEKCEHTAVFLPAVSHVVSAWEVLDAVPVFANVTDRVEYPLVDGWWSCGHQRGSVFTHALSAPGMAAGVV